MLLQIEDLKSGDIVWTWNEETGDISLKSVKRVFINESDELIHLTINGDEIVTTPNYPFYVAHKGWYAAVDLRAGDVLVLVNGEYVTLEKTQHEILEASITVYNFEVEGYHTYFVGTDGVLVHNMCQSTGIFENTPYHTTGNPIKSAVPINGQAALNNSFQLSPTSSRRIGISEGQFVVLDQTSPGLYHGHVRAWDELTQEMKNVLIRAGLVTRKGKIIG